MAGSPTAKNADKLVSRAREIGIADYSDADNPAILWDLYGEQGHAIRTTVSEMGPLLLARLMGLNETQEGVLNIVFRVADEEGLLLLDLKDLRAMLAHVAENSATLRAHYGNVSAATVGAIQRQVLVLENQGADALFGEPALQIEDLMRVDASGKGVISILAADRLMGAPRLYSCFLLWLLSELFEQLPEVGDPEKPRLVFFFDEAHLLFDEAPKVLLDKVEQVVRLIRSKGVGVYFVTQNPLDVPDKVLSQLGNRVQHALRAFTPRDQKAVKTAAETFRPNPRLDTARVITELGKGEALVSLLEGNGTPAMVERMLVRPPAARVGPISPQERQALIAASPLGRVYGTAVDRHSAFEALQGRTQEKTEPVQPEPPPSGPWGRTSEPPPRRSTTSVPSTRPATRAPSDEAPRAPAPRTSTRMSTTELVVRQVARSVASQVGTQLGRAILRGILGGMRK
jgi:DNA helicase HerA-like ATPase